MNHNDDTGYECDQCGECIAEDEDHVHGKFRYCEECYRTVGKPKEGRCWYDIDPLASVLYAVEGPEGYKIEDIDFDNLPDDFEYVSDDRWEWFARYTHIVSLFPDGRVEHRGVGKGLGKTLHNLFEMGGME